MKALVSFLAGVLAAIIGASFISFMSGNNIAIQFGGRDNKIEQSTPSQPHTAPAATPQQIPQNQAPATAPTQAPSATTTQPPPTVSSAPLLPPQPAVVPTQQTYTAPQRHLARRSNPPEYVQDCSCPVDVVSEDEADVEDAPEEAEDCECEEPPAI